MSGPSRDLELARGAFTEGDVDASILAHNRKVLVADEAHKTESGRYIKSIVFGGLDGIITTFSIVAGVAGANLTVDFALVLGFANLLADGISMGFGDYISSKAESDYIKGELVREKWEMEKYPEGEIKEMIEIYVSKGFSQEDAEVIITTMAKNEKFFVDHMLVEELGLNPPDEDDSPLRNGLVTFASFIMFGFIPLLSFVVFAPTSVSFQVVFAVACVLTAFTLLALGYVKAHISGLNRLSSSLSVLFNGTLAAGSAYLIGWGLGEAFNISSSCS